MREDFLPWVAGIEKYREQMLADTMVLAEINSGSFNVAGVERVAATLENFCAKLQAKSRRIDLEPYEYVDERGELKQRPLARALHLQKRPHAPMQVLFVAHMDTVFAVDHPFQNLNWIDDNTLNGPGVADLKGGIVVLLKAIETFEKTPWAEKLGWQILFNPDEEIGSPGSAPLLRKAAKQCHIGLVYEPCFSDGNLAGARKGSGNFSVAVRGRAAHAGREHHLGRNAIRALCDFIRELDDLNGKRQGVTINPGFIHGGGAVNAVPDRAMARFNIRIEQAEDESWCLKHIEALRAKIDRRDGISLGVHGSFGRAPKVLSTTNKMLFELVQECGDALGMALETRATGGCCDGNNLAAAGLPNVDTLGVRGGNIHSSDEYLVVSSLTERASLSALLLMSLANTPVGLWKERQAQ